MAPETKKRLLLLGVAAVAVAALGARVMISSPPGDTAVTRHPTGRAQPVIRQAAWKIRSFRAGPPAALGRRAQKRLEVRRRRLKALVKEVYEALFLRPTELPSTTRRYFAPEAGRALRATRAGMPGGALRVKTLRRRARIGIDVSTIRRAAAEVSIVAKSMAAEKSVRVRHRAHMWMSLEGGRWRILAYEIDQRPVPTRRAAA